MPTLNLLNSLIPTGSWNTDSIAPYDMQPYDYSLIQTNVVMDALNPLIEITNIPVGAMIANPPAKTAPYNSSIIEDLDLYKFFFIETTQPTIIDIIPYQYEADFVLTIVATSSNYNAQTKELTFGFDLKHTSLINPPSLDYVTQDFYYFDLSNIYYDNGIILGECIFNSDSNMSPREYSFLPNEIQSSYSVISKDPANRKAVIRVDKSIDNLKPPLNRLFLNFDKTP